MPAAVPASRRGLEAWLLLSEVSLGVLLLWIAAVGSGRLAIEARWAR
ncbi:hypothetical protein ABH900_003925 [Stenotrophomonas sp. AN71]